MKILIIAQYYQPDITAAAFRITETAELLAQRGHSVTVVTAEPHRTQAADPSHASRALEEGRRAGQPEQSQRPQQPEQPEQLEQPQQPEQPRRPEPNPPPQVVRVPIEPFSRGGMKAYLRHYFSFVIRARRRVADLITDGFAPDVVWTSSPPLFVGLAGTKAAKNAAAPLVLDVRDVWPDTAVAAGQLSESGVGYRLGKVLERHLYRRAAAITCVAQPMADYIRQERGGRRSSAKEQQIAVIYNGSGGGPSSAAADPEKTIVYAGNLGRLQGIDSLLQAWAKSHEVRRLGWKVEIIGDGVLASELKELTRTLHIDETVRFRGVVSKEQSIAATRGAGILFLNLLPNPVFDLTIPSKLFDYLATGRPIIGGIRGEGRSVLNQLPGNATPAPSDADEIAEAIGALTAGDAWRPPREENVAAADEKFSRARNTDRLEKLLQAVAGTR